MASVTSKKRVVSLLPDARLDFYEVLRGHKKPCWFIRIGMQGSPISDICPTPRQAWADADKSIQDGMVVPKLLLPRGYLTASCHLPRGKAAA